MREKPNLDKEESVVGDLLSQLDFAEEDVVRAAIANPRLFIKAGEYRVNCLREKNRAEMVAEKTKAERGLAIRQEAHVNGDRLTENGLTAMLLVDPLVEKATKQLFAKEEQDEFAKLLVEAYRMRRDCLEIIGRIAGTEMSYQKALEATADRMAETRRQLSAKYKGTK